MFHTLLLVVHYCTILYYIISHQPTIKMFLFISFFRQLAVLSGHDFYDSINQLTHDKSNFPLAKSHLTNPNQNRTQMCRAELFAQRVKMSVVLAQLHVCKCIASHPSAVGRRKSSSLSPAGAVPSSRPMRPAIRRVCRGGAVAKKVHARAQKLHTGRINGTYSRYSVASRVVYLREIFYAAR